MSAKKIFFGNYKGGVGKTTSVFQIAHFASEKGKKILLLDLDPQSSLSEICAKEMGGDLSQIAPTETLNYIFDLSITKVKKYKSMELQFETKKFIKPCHNFYFIPSSLFYGKNLGLDELAIQMDNTIEFLSILKQFIDNIEKQNTYDYIFLDCPPSSTVITQSAFAVSDYYAIPTVLDGLSTNGVIHYIETVTETYEKLCGMNAEDGLFCKHFFGEKPQLLGIFFTLIRAQINYDKAYGDLVTQLQNKFNTPIPIFENHINNYIEIARSTGQGQPSSLNDYEKLTDEFLRKIV